MSYLLLVRKGDKYGPEYPRILRKQARQFGLETVVLGDDIPFQHDWPGWWSKMEIFDPRIPKPFIYIDLDSYILGDITPLMGKTLICREWHPNVKGKTGGCGRYQSSIIAMAEDRMDIWRQWIRMPDYWMNEFRGDQRFISQFDWECIQDYYPGMVGSYKFHNLDEPRTKIVTFHGKPKMKDAEGWAKDLWISLNNSEKP